MLFTFAEYFLQINFISLDALLRNSEQIKLSEFLKRNKNLTFPITLAIGLYNSLYYCTSRNQYRRHFGRGWKGVWLPNVECLPPSMIKFTYLATQLLVQSMFNQRCIELCTYDVPVSLSHAWVAKTLDERNVWLEVFDFLLDLFCYVNYSCNGTISTSFCKYCMPLTLT